MLISNPDLETETFFSISHCEHLQGARLHAIVPSSVRFVKLSVSARRRGNLMEKGEIASLSSQ